jgi:hypothetical protein
MTKDFGKVIRISTAAWTRIVQHAAAMQQQTGRPVSLATALEDLLADKNDKE